MYGSSCPTLATTAVCFLHSNSLSYLFYPFPHLEAFHSSKEKILDYLQSTIKAFNLRHPQSNPNPKGYTNICVCVYPSIMGNKTQTQVILNMVSENLLHCFPVHTRVNAYGMTVGQLGRGFSFLTPILLLITCQSTILLRLENLLRIF